MYRKYLQELSDRPATARLQQLSDRPATAHLQELSDPLVFPETHLIVDDAHLKAARAGAAHREQFRNSQLDCVTASVSPASTVASGDGADKPPLAVQLAGHTAGVECQSVSASATGHSIHAKPGGSNITINQSPTRQSVSHDDSGVDTSPSAQNHSPASSSIRRPEVRSSGYGSVVRRFRAVKSNGRDSAVSCSSEDKYRDWSSSGSHSSGVKSKGRGSTSSQSPKVEARGRSSSVSQSPEIKSGDRISCISHSAEITSRGQGSADCHSSQTTSRRRGSAVSRSSEVKSRGRGISQASEASYGRPEKWDARRYSETIHLHDFMSRSNTPEFRRRPLDFLVTNEEDTRAARLGGVSQASRPSPKRMWDEDSFSNPSQDEVIVSRPVVDASKVNSPLYPIPRGDLILPILQEKARHASPGLPFEVIQVKPIHTDPHEESKTFLKGNGLTSPPSRFSTNLQVEMSPWGRRPPAPRAPQKAKMLPDTASTLGCYPVFCCRLRTPNSSSGTSSTTR
ncbi:uncharacterized protein [Procambarus clarkii]|uniref:uncharacterized protein n=1 Tax=Procambarus clarkii TaxID=6728 RepID=UPI001E678AE3|nr:uncharacterized protein LOC123758374 [Procambarus clarkii]